MNTKLPYLLLISVCVAAHAFAQSPSAKDATGVSITPASVEARVKPGSTYDQTFSIKNATSSTLRLRVSLNDVGYDANNARINAPAGTLERSASNWININSDPVVIKPQSSQDVKVFITVPTSAVGTYATAPVFDLLPESGIAATSVANIGIKFRALVLLTTDSGNEYHVEPRSSTVVPPSASAPLSVRTTLLNRGNSLTHVRGEFAILDESGKLKGRGQLSPRRVIPGQTADITGEWLGHLEPGSYTCLLSLTNDRGNLQPISMTREITFQVK